MTRRTLGFIFLGTGLTASTGAVLLFLTGIVTVFRDFAPVATLSSPGATSIRVPAAGAYTLWHDHRVLDGPNPMANPEALPPGMSFLFLRSSDGTTFGLQPLGGTTTLSLPDRASVSVGTFEPDQPGDYQLRISATGGEKRQFSLTEGAFLGGVAKLGLRLILACLLGLFGVVFFVLGLIFVLLKAKPRLQSAGS